MIRPEAVRSSRRAIGKGCGRNRAPEFVLLKTIGYTSPTFSRMTRLKEFPGFFITLLTLGIARARWIADTNRQLNAGGAGFWFAWFFPPFANYGVVGRMNNALAAAGSGHRESPLLCFFLAGWPFVGSKRRMKRGTQALNNAWAVRHQAASVVNGAAAGIPSAPENPPATV